MELAGILTIRVCVCVFVGPIHPPTPPLPSPPYIHITHASTPPYLRVGSSALSLRPAATNLLTDLKLLRFHEPIELRRAGFDPSDLPPNLVAKAKVIRYGGGGRGERRGGRGSTLQTDLPSGLVVSKAR